MIYQLDKSNIGEFLRRFDQLDGAVLKSFSYRPSSKLGKYKLVILFTVNDSTLVADKPFESSKTIELLISGNVEFRISEPGGGASTVLNDEVINYNYDGKLYLNFDPLHSKDWSHESWTIEEVRNSSFYVGGNSIAWRVIPVG